MTPQEYIEGKVSPEPNTGCWLWAASTYPNGYGQGWFKGHHAVAHKLSYEAFVGPVPDGLDLDHLCRQRSCVNPAHLEPVTRSVNALRGLTGKCGPEKTHCPQGHKYDEANTAHYASGRQCKTCVRERSLNRYYRLKSH